MAKENFHQIVLQASEAIESGQLDTAMELLQPLLNEGKNPEAFRLLGLVQLHQSNIQESISTFKKALNLERNAIILSNLANAYVHYGDYIVAEKLCREGLTLEDLPELYNTLGSILAIQKKYDEATQKFIGALTHRPEYFQAQWNLVNARFLSGDIEGAFQDCLKYCFKKTCQKSSFTDKVNTFFDELNQLPLHNSQVIGIVKEIIFFVVPVREWITWAQRIFQLSTHAEIKYETWLRQTIAFWILNFRQNTQVALREAAQIREQGICNTQDIKNMIAYESYLLALNKTSDVIENSSFPRANVLGDSHVLSWSNQIVELNCLKYSLESELIMGAKAFHVSSTTKNQYKWRIQHILGNFSKSSPLVLSFGEIDCRLDEGILPYARISGELLDDLVQRQVSNYVQSILKLTRYFECVWLTGVPAPNMTFLRDNYHDYKQDDFLDLIKVISLWNVFLSYECSIANLGFIDLYDLSVSSDGMSNQNWHCDGVHLLPEAIVMAKWISPDSHITSGTDNLFVKSNKISLDSNSVPISPCHFQQDLVESDSKILRCLSNGLFTNFEKFNKESFTMSTKQFLHIGCGPKYKDQTTREFKKDFWKEIRLDIDPKAKPDINGTMTDMSRVESNSMDAIFSSHNIEHLYPHEIPVALAEFLRVLKPEGYLVVTCPDLQSVCALVAEDKLTEAAYTAPAGPIAPIDILYGHRPSLASGNLFMAHRCGFTKKVLSGTLGSHGFSNVAIKSRKHPYYDLWAVASKSAISNDEILHLAKLHFPA